MFIAQTRLVRTAQVNGDQSITFFDPPQPIARFPGIVRESGAALNALTPVPAANQWGGYALAYDRQFVYTLKIAGTNAVATSLLVVFYDVWNTDADRLANPTSPLFRNTHTMQIDPGLSAAVLRARVRQNIETTIVDTVVGNRAVGDQRDTRLVATQTDPSGVLNKAQSLDGSVTVVADVIDTSSPLLPNPEGN